MPVTHEITGSNPVASAIDAAVAQSVEQRTENPRVGGSIPPCGTTKFEALQRLQVFSVFISGLENGRRHHESEERKDNIGGGDNFAAHM